MAEYPTRPLESWDKLKELRRGLFFNMWKAKEEGNPIVQGVIGSSTAIFAGIGEPILTGLGPNFGRISRDPKATIKCHEVTESKGFKTDICATARLSIGSLYSGTHSLSPTGEEFTPDFCFEILVCPHQPKANMIFRDYYDIPYFIVEVPRYSETPNEHHRKYYISQLQDAIDWMEKVFGKKYDEEKLVEATITEWETRVLWAKICMLVKTIPAPIDVTRLFMHTTPLMRMGAHNKVCKHMLEVLHAELEDRVKDGIAILATERFRLIHDGFAPFYYTGLYRLARKYDAVVLGGRMYFSSMGAYAVKEDGSWEVAKTPKERGIEIKTRDDALEALADMQLIYYPFSRIYTPVGNKDVVKVVEDWHADGAILHIDQGCRWTTTTIFGVRDALREKGIPTVTYQSNAYDPRYFNEAEFENRIDTFLENMGAKKAGATT